MVTTIILFDVYSTSGAGFTVVFDPLLIQIDFTIVLNEYFIIFAV
jgi:hypothetical protein